MFRRWLLICGMLLLAANTGCELHLIEPLGDVTVVSVEAGGEMLRMVLAEQNAAGLKPGDPGFEEKKATMVKDNSVYDIASVYAVQDVIRPERTRDYLIRMLGVHQLRLSKGIGKHLLATWPTSF